MIVFTNSKLLYDSLVKLGSTPEKRLIVDLIYLLQSYKWQKIIEIRWINGNNNLTNTMTKTKPCAVLQKLININTISLNTTRWIEWEDATYV